MNLEDIVLSETSQSQKAKYCLRLYEVSKIVKPTEAESRTVVARGWQEEEEMGSCYSMDIKFQLYA